MFFSLLAVASILGEHVFSVGALSSEESGDTQDNVETPPDSLTPRWRIQPTIPLVVEDLDSSALDLQMPDNIVQTVEMDTTGSGYRIGMKIGDTFLNTPILMTTEEYMQWTERRQMQQFFHKGRAEDGCHAEEH